MRLDHLDHLVLTKANQLSEECVDLIKQHVYVDSDDQYKEKGISLFLMELYNPVK